MSLKRSESHTKVDGSDKDCADDNDNDADEDGHRQKKAKRRPAPNKRVRSRCQCECRHGLLQLYEPEDNAVLHQCECTCCGPVREGIRRCEVQLNGLGAETSLITTGRILCQDCRDPMFGLQRIFATAPRK